jgi:hypothetical protein
LTLAVGVALGASGASALTMGLTDLGTCNTSQLTTSTDCEGAFEGNDANSNLDGLFSKSGWTKLSGVSLSLTGAGGTSGTWSVSGWGSLTTVMAVLKGGPTFAAYLLDLSATSGDWNTSGLLKGNLTPGPGLSHFEFYSTEPSAVPLPAAGWMLIAGLGGLGLMGRSRRRAA